ncbi:hypothetical protein KSP39_PZI000039 [Platanthera zijinensis]|uniref:Uncharacterized protein n=1 Tax=Platanthera zijinensis TaxID=2320716 RepID=A0AAP0GF35_9ASPA
MRMSLAPSLSLHRQSLMVASASTALTNGEALSALGTLGIFFNHRPACFTLSFDIGTATVFSGALLGAGTRLFSASFMRVWCTWILFSTGESRMGRLSRCSTRPGSWIWTLRGGPLSSTVVG